MTEAQGVQGPPGVRGPDGVQMPLDQYERMMADVTSTLMRDYVFRRPWWKFWAKR